jgi:hypothetical protein
MIATHLLTTFSSPTTSSFTPGSVAESSRSSDGLLEAQRVLLQKLTVRRFI